MRFKFKFSPLFILFIAVVLAVGSYHWFESIKNQRQYPVKGINGPLTAMQYKVTQQDGTEPRFANEYWNCWCLKNTPT